MKYNNYLISCFLKWNPSFNKIHFLQFHHNYNICHLNKNNDFFYSLSSTRYLQCQSTSSEFIFSNRYPSILLTLISNNQNEFQQTSRRKIEQERKKRMERRCGVVVSTWDFESHDLGSNPSSAFFSFFISLFESVYDLLMTSKIFFIFWFFLSQNTSQRMNTNIKEKRNEIGKRMIVLRNWYQLMKLIVILLFSQIGYFSIHNRTSKKKQKNNQQNLLNVLKMKIDWKMNKEHWLWKKDYIYCEIESNIFILSSSLSFHRKKWKIPKERNDTLLNIFLYSFIIVTESFSFFFR